MSPWIPIARASDCPPGSGHELLAGDRIIALFNVRGKFYALDGICPHQGGPLGKGCLTDGVVSCPWHGWRFDVRTGQHQASKTLVQPGYEVRVQDGVVEVNLQRPEASV